MTTINVTVTTSGLDQLDRLIALTSSDIAKAVADGMSDTTELETVMRDAIYSTGIHRQTGHLEQSASFDLTSQSWPIEMVAAYGAEYAKYLDQGTDNGIQPYGFLAVATERLKPMIAQRVRDAIQRRLERD